MEQSRLNNWSSQITWGCRNPRSQFLKFCFFKETGWAKVLKMFSMMDMVFALYYILILCYLRGRTYQSITIYSGFHIMYAEYWTRLKPELLTAPRWHATYLIYIYIYLNLVDEMISNFFFSSFIQAAVRGRSTACFWSGPALDQDQLVGIRQVWSNVWKGESSKVSAFQTLCWATITQLAQNVSFSLLSQYDVSRDGEPGGGGEYNVQVFPFHALMVKLMCLQTHKSFEFHTEPRQFFLPHVCFLNKFSHSRTTLSLPFHYFYPP